VKPQLKFVTFVANANAFSRIITPEHKTLLIKVILVPKIVTQNTKIEAKLSLWVTEQKPWGGGGEWQE
jgi:hypothetical protein